METAPGTSGEKTDFLQVKVRIHQETDLVKTQVSCDCSKCQDFSSPWQDKEPFPLQGEFAQCRLFCKTSWTLSRTIYCPKHCRDTCGQVELLSLGKKRPNHSADPERLKSRAANSTCSHQQHHVHPIDFLHQYNKRLENTDTGVVPSPIPMTSVLCSAFCQVVWKLAFFLSFRASDSAWSSAWESSVLHLTTVSAQESANLCLFPSGGMSQKCSSLPKLGNSCWGSHPPDTNTPLLSAQHTKASDTQSFSRCDLGINSHTQYFDTMPHFWAQCVKIDIFT